MYIVRHTITYIVRHIYGTYTQQKGCSRPNHEMKPKCGKTKCEPTHGFHTVWLMDGTRTEKRISNDKFHSSNVCNTGVPEDQTSPRRMRHSPAVSSSSFATRASPRTKRITIDWDRIRTGNPQYSGSHSNQ